MGIIKVLSNKYGKHKILVDDDDHARALQIPWHIHMNGSACYAVTNPTKTQKHRSLHRFILGIKNPKTHVDHINGNGLDCRRSNLRIATKQQNGWNRGKNKNNSTGFKGVSLSKEIGRKKRYESKLIFNYKTIHLGRFFTAQEAALAYEKKCKELYGPFYRPQEL